MNISQPSSLQNTLFYFLASLLLFALYSCKTEKKSGDAASSTTEEAAAASNTIQIITEEMDFQMPDTIPSGWNTFVYKNLSPQTHFFLVDKYPEGKTIVDAKETADPIFAEGMRLINEGKMDEAMTAFGKLPEWFQDVQYMGGSGLISPGKTCQTTINLPPGYYLVECYVKMPNGVFHTTMGMVEALVVSDEKSEVEEPEAAIAIDISSTEGIVVNDSITAGTHTFSVTYKDQSVYENFVGHDVNLVKMRDTSDVKVLEHWMNWTDPKGLIEPAPQGFTFLGGVNNMSAGNTGYFTATLDPGNYALISEVPNAISKGLFKSFTVSD